MVSIILPTEEEGIGSDLGEELDIQNSNTSADDDNLKEDTAESVVSKQQNYPNLLGLTFVVNQGTNIKDDLTVSLSFRKYNNIKKKNCFTRKIAIWVPEYENEIEDAINKYFNALFNVPKFVQLLQNRFESSLCILFLGNTYTFYNRIYNILYLH